MTNESHNVRMYKNSPDTDSSRMDVSSYCNLGAFTGRKVHAVGHQRVGEFNDEGSWSGGQVVSGNPRAVHVLDVDLEAHTGA